MQTTTRLNTLSPEQVKFFGSEGYLFPFRVMSREQAAIHRRNIEECQKQAAEQKVEKALKLKSYLSIQRLYNLVRNPAVLDVVEDLIGPNLLVVGAALFIKDFNDHRFVSWHDDSAYFGFDPVEAVTTWTGFTDSTIENGCLRVIPKSHLEPDEKHRHVETFDKNNLLSRGQTLVDVDESQAVNMLMEAGQFEAHNIRLVHGSEGNHSPDKRIGFNTVYIPTHVASTIGRRSALLVRGEDRHHHWDPEPAPRHDLDPIAVAHAIKSFDDYLTLSKNQASARKPAGVAV